MAIGLPFAVVTGWALGAPADRQTTLGAADIDGPFYGDGGLGSAPGGTDPARTGSDGYTARPPRATADPAASQPVPASGPSTVTTVVTVTRTAVPSSPVQSTDPQLTNPPVPTPTQVSSPPDPSETPPVPTPTQNPSASDPTFAPGLERLIRSGYRPWK
ncbi:hypothetical protein [Actinoplanes italicus]|uniref:hypothetical protein n=1 Tax=Actinoplanes italicus TaxID=113567 RepID=UPI0011B23AEE|nr:hypothetical protein [Actinoplanes italicus]